MNRLITILRYTLFGLVLLIVIAFLSWYFAIRTIKSTVEENDAARNGSLSAPFGNAIGSTYENVVSSLTSPAGGKSGEEKLPQLSQISKTPTSAARFVQIATSTRLRFVERSTGYVLEAPLETRRLARLTNVLLPRIYEGVFATKDRVIMRSIDEAGRAIAIAASLSATSSAGSPLSLTRQRLPDNIRAIAASPAGDELFYILEKNGIAVGIRASWGGTENGGKQIFSSIISGWHVLWPSAGKIILVQNASDGAAGYAYTLEKGGALSPLVRNMAGLSLLPDPFSPTFLYSESGAELRLYARIDGSAPAIRLPIKTTADKCVWAPASPKDTQDKSLIVYCAVPQVSPDNNFLGRWYRGEVHTADSWWRVSVNANSAELLYTPGDILDVENPVIDGSGNYIAFINGIDKSLWLLRTNKD